MINKLVSLIIMKLKFYLLISQSLPLKQKTITLIISEIQITLLILTGFTVSSAESGQTIALVTIDSANTGSVM